MASVWGLMGTFGLPNSTVTASVVLLRIGRLTPTGVLTEFPIPTPNSLPVRIIAGPDRALWFTEYNSGVVGHITTAGTVTELPMKFGEPDGITVRSGHVWITEEQTDKVDEISTIATLLTIDLAAHSGPEDVAVGPGNSLWVSEYYSQRIARVTISSP